MVIKSKGKLRKVSDLSHIFVSKFVTKEEGRMLKQLQDERRGIYSAKEGNMIKLGGKDFDITEGKLLIEDFSLRFVLNREQMNRADNLCELHKEQNHNRGSYALEDEF